jgi:hypothetical protein
VKASLEDCYALYAANRHARIFSSVVFYASASAYGGRHEAADAEKLRPHVDTAAIAVAIRSNDS